MKLISPIVSIGLENGSERIKGAAITFIGKKNHLTRLFTLGQENDVKPLYTDHPIITTGLNGKEVLVRYLHMPVTKEKDIEEALSFQAEPLLPFPVDQALLSYHILSKSQEETDLALFAVRKEAIDIHLENWKSLKIEPERIGCVQAALCHFGNAYIPFAKTYLIFHIQANEMIGLLIKEGKLFASYSHPDGLKTILATNADRTAPFPKDQNEWREELEQDSSRLGQGVKKLQRELAKMTLALAKEVKRDEIETVLITGEAAMYEGLSQILAKNIPFPYSTCESTNEFSSQDLLSYAVPIGLALSALPEQGKAINFRQQEYSYPHPWRRLLKPIAAYFTLMIILSFAFYFYSQKYLAYKENQLRQTYIDLLAGMHKSHDQFEIAYLSKNPKAHAVFNGDIPKIEQIDQDSLRERIAFLQKELQASPDSFPLYPNTPRVSDVLAWLTQHPTVVQKGETNSREPRIQIENFSYTMIKRPQQGKKQEKYQVKIELEFTSPTPKWAREFHDALIAPNDWVDPKGEVKWNTNRGKYKTTFFLKDKTIYPSM